MSKTLYLPEHVAQKINKEKGEAKAEPDSLKSAYVDANERVLDPSLLDKPLLERLPQPTGWRVLVMPYQGKAKTTSGLYIPDEIRERESVATVVAYVCIGRYSGSRFKIDGGEVRIINDDEVIATLLEPDDIKHV